MPLRPVSPAPGCFSLRLRGPNDLQARQAPALPGTVSLKAPQLKQWLTEEKAVVGKHGAGSEFLATWSSADDQA